MSEAVPATEYSLASLPDEELAAQEPLSLVVLPAIEPDKKPSSLKRSAQLGIALAEITPVNEFIRGGAFVGGEALSHNPAVGALTLGLSTLAVEGAGALAAASLFNTETSRRFNDYLRGRLEKVGYSRDQQLSPYSMAAATFMGGSVVGMALDTFNNPDRTTAERRKFGLVATAWLAGSCAVAGAMGSEAVDYTMHNPAVSGAIAGSVSVAAVGRKLKNAFTRRAEVRRLLQESQPTIWLDHDKYGHEYGLINDTARLQKAAKLEQDVWDEKDYGNLTEEGYDKHIEHSRTFAAFKNDECVGMNRMFRAINGVVPPFLEKEMPYSSESERQEIIDLARQGLVEELGTVALDPEVRNKHVNLRLYRLAYRDARQRGIKYWGIIMEPERVEKMNKYNGFTFRQLGEPVHYQGGDCAAHIMDLEEVDRTMHKQHPLNHYWFTKLKIHP